MTRQILLVEDNPDEVELIITALKDNHIYNEVIVAFDGVEALDYLFATGEHTGRDTDDMPTVILLDINLPRLDGHEVLRQIRADDRTKLLPVVMLTSSDRDEDKVAAYTQGANSYVRKPVDFAEFIVAVQRLGLYWLLLNSGPPNRQ